MQQVALVTGGSRGIGAGICQALAGQGLAVIVNYRRNADAAEQVVQSINRSGGSAVAVQADISRPDDRDRLVQQAFDWQGRLDVLVNNAGIAPPRRVDLLELEETEYRQVLEVNLNAVFFLSQAVVRRMLAQPGESRRVIINISSVSAEFASTDRAAYCISKAGMGMLTQLLAARLAGEGIGVYEIRPGITATDMTAPVKEKYDRMIADGLLPMPRWGQPEDVARIVAAIVAGHFDYATGQVFYADGGLHIRRL